MNILEIQLQNCFGIGKLDHKFEFGQLATNSFLIYAPNGTMKTSFAKTLDLIAKNDTESIASVCVRKKMPRCVSPRTGTNNSSVALL